MKAERLHYPKSKVYHMVKILHCVVQVMLLRELSFALECSDLLRCLSKHCCILMVFMLSFFQTCQGVVMALLYVTGKEFCCWLDQTKTG